MTVRLWFVKDAPSGLARLYCRVPKSRNPGQPTPDNKSFLWVPRSIVESTRKEPPDGEEWPQHHLNLPDWFVLGEEL